MAEVTIVRRVQPPFQPPSTGGRRRVPYKRERKRVAL